MTTVLVIQAWVTLRRLIVLTYEIFSCYSSQGYPSTTGRSGVRELFLLFNPGTRDNLLETLGDACLSEDAFQNNNSGN